MVVECVAIVVVLLAIMLVFLRSHKKSYILAIVPLLFVPVAFNHYSFNSQTGRNAVGSFSDFGNPFGTGERLFDVGNIGFQNEVEKKTVYLSGNQRCICASAYLVFDFLGCASHLVMCR